MLRIIIRKVRLFLTFVLFLIVLASFHLKNVIQGQYMLRIIIRKNLRLLTCVLFLIVLASLH